MIWGVNCRGKEKCNDWWCGHIGKGREPGFDGDGMHACHRIEVFELMVDRKGGDRKGGDRKGGGWRGTVVLI